MKQTSKLRQTLRREARKQRKSITGASRKKAAINLCRTIVTSDWFRNAKTIALYLPNDGEIDPTGIIPIGEAMKKRFYLPILRPDGKNQLWFSPFSINQADALITNRFGIPEPRPSAPPHCKTVHQLDLLLMPLVCFDTKGARLGMGGGFYDRTLRNHARFPNPKRVGVAFEAQKLNALPACSWDVPLNGIMTEKRVYIHSQTKPTQA